MRVSVGNVRLFFDVEGAKYRVKGGDIVEKPIIILLHGGPGFDHTGFKPSFSVLSQIAQLVYYEHRGCGRSDYGPATQWTLQQWARDLKAFIEALEIEHPVIYGVSFGGWVAQQFAVEFPDLAARFIFASTSARFSKVRSIRAFKSYYGDRFATVADRFWNDMDAPGSIDKYFEVCLPRYNPTEVADFEEILRRKVMNYEVLRHFFRKGGEAEKFDFRERLGRVRRPVLVTAGDKDPVTTIEDALEMTKSLPADVVQFELFEGAGHSVETDCPDSFFKTMERFVLGDCDGD